MMRFKPLFVCLYCLTPGVALAASPVSGLQFKWTATHGAAGLNTGVTSEIPAFDALTNTLWVAGVVGVDVLNAKTGSLVQHIDTRSYGSINSVAIYNGKAAMAFESSTDRTANGQVVVFDTVSRTQNGSAITVGALPDMLAFTPNGSKLLVANEGTPTTYGARIDTSVPRNYGAPVNDPAGSVSIIDMASRTVTATAGFAGVPQTGSNIRTNTGMNFEPEYIALNKAGTKAYVSLQEANAIGVLDLNTNTFEKVVGLGTKDFSLPGNRIDPLNNGTVDFVSVSVKGLYMPDGMATYQSGGQTYIVMANEGDFREDDGDRSAASSLGATGVLANLRVSNTDSSPGNLYAPGGRSFSIRDENGGLIFDSGEFLDVKANELGIYDDARSRDKGVEPEGVELLEIGGRTLAFIGLERTTKGAVAIYDVTNPHSASFIDMIVTNGDRAPEGLEAFEMDGLYYLAIANETSNTTSVYSLAAVPEPETYAMFLAGLGLVGVMARVRKERRV